MVPIGTMAIDLATPTEGTGGRARQHRDHRERDELRELNGVAHPRSEIAITKLMVGDRTPSRIEKILAEAIISTGAPMPTTPDLAGARQRLVPVAASNVGVGTGE